MDITDIEYHPTKLSQCCGSPIYMDYDICSSCNDHCGYEEEEEDNDTDKVNYSLAFFGIWLALFVAIFSYAQKTYIKKQ